MQPLPKFSPRLKLIFDIIPGESTADDLFDRRKYAQDHGWLTPDCRTIAFITGEHTRLNPKQLGQLQQRFQTEIPENQDTTTAIVASSPIATALVKLFAIDHAQPRNVDVFSTLPAALAFLKLKPSEVFQEFPDMENLP